MKVKKYTAPTMPEAMKIVKSDLGKQAVILNSREQKTRGFLGLFRKRYIEVFAAVDPNPGIQTPYRRKPFQTKSNTQVTQHNIKPEQPEVSGEILKEISELKKQLNENESNKNLLPQPIQNIYSQLENQGFNQSSISEVVPLLLEKYYSKQATDEKQLLTHVKQYYYSKLKGQAFNDDRPHSKLVYLFGPTGVGKTTTIAKLAALSSISEDKKIAFITLDTYRIAAIDQLKTYAKILNVPIEVAYNKQDFEKAKKKFDEYDLIFVDSAGRNYRKDEYLKQVKSLVTFDGHEEIYCVLSLTSKNSDLDDIYTRFSMLGIRNVIFTKADETTEFGSIYNLWKKHQFKISYITYGQSVPDDIQKASPELLVDMLVGEKEW